MRGQGIWQLRSALLPPPPPLPPPPARQKPRPIRAWVSARGPVGGPGQSLQVVWVVTLSGGSRSYSYWHQWGPARDAAEPQHTGPPPRPPNGNHLAQGVLVPRLRHGDFSVQRYTRVRRTVRTLGALRSESCVGLLVWNQLEKRNQGLKDSGGVKHPNCQADLPAGVPGAPPRALKKCCHKSQQLYGRQFSLPREQSASTCP